MDANKIIEGNRKTTRFFYRYSVVALSLLAILGAVVLIYTGIYFNPDGENPVLPPTTTEQPTTTTVPSSNDPVVIEIPTVIESNNTREQDRETVVTVPVPATSPETTTTTEPETIINLDPLLPTPLLDPLCRAVNELGVPLC